MDRLKKKTCFLFDLDGTIYLSEHLIPGATELLDEIRKQGKNFAFMTNNSSSTKKQYLDKFKALGIDVTAKEVLTSTDATLRYLKLQKMKKIVLLATPEVEKEFEEAGFFLVKERGLEADCVVLTFDISLTYEKIWTAYDYLVKGTAYIASHPDYLCPLKDGAKPDVGSFISLFQTACHREPLIIGKPNHYMVDEAMDRFGISKEEMVIVGDRLYTDIRTGLRSGVTTIAVLSGETTKDMLKNTEDTPDYVFPSVKEIFEHIKK